MYDIIGSIVLYKTNIKDLEKVIQSFFNTKLNVKLYLSDNSPTRELENYILDLHNENIEYVFNNKNGGYGYGHNIILNMVKEKAKYFLVLNPDIYFDYGVLDNIFDYMEKNAMIGQLMPRVENENGELQYLCKRYPTLSNLFIRRFCPFKNIVKRTNYFYEMHDKDYNSIMEVPLLSGCFMFLRMNILAKINGFDTNFFMYFEDYDLCRRMSSYSKIIYYPKVRIVHKHEKSSYKNKKMLIEHIKSTIRYYIKWYLRK